MCESQIISSRGTTIWPHYAKTRGYSCTGCLHCRRSLPHLAGDAKPLAGWTHPRLRAKSKITVRSTPFFLIQKKAFFEVSTIFILSLRICIISYLIISYSKSIRASRFKQLSDMLSNFDDFRIFFRLIVVFNNNYFMCIYKLQSSLEIYTLKRRL